MLSQRSDAHPVVTKFHRIAFEPVILTDISPAIDVDSSERIALPLVARPEMAPGRRCEYGPDETARP
jgi:hypothetical protein